MCKKRKDMLQLHMNYGMRKKKNMPREGAQLIVVHIITLLRINMFPIYSLADMFSQHFMFLTFKYNYILFFL